MLMTIRILIPVVFFCKLLPAQPVQVNIHIFEAELQNITSAMVCITRLGDSAVLLPPDGRPAGQATYPNIFFGGIPYSNERNWTGPLRKMKGAGAVNGQRTYVYKDNISLPYFDEPVMYQTNGEFSIMLMPGLYRISIQHGNEYIPVRENFRVKKSQQPVNESFLLKRWIDLPARGWYSGDVHSHHASNKAEYRDYMSQFAKAEDVHLLNVLEMGDRQATYFKAPAFGPGSAICAGNSCLAFGQEEPRSEYGHIIGLNIGKLARDTAHYNEYDIVFDSIHKSPDALVGFAHFAYKGEGVTKGMALYGAISKIDFVELLQNTQINQEDYYDYLNLGFRITAAAGSDFPWGSTIGDGRVFVYTGDQFSPDRWFEGMMEGRTFVSNGPALFLEVNKKLPGTEIRASLNESIEIRASALSNPAIGIIDRVELYNNDGLLARIKNENAGDSLTVNFSQKILKSQWITAAAFCRNGALAHTSPVYIVADGKPVFDRKKAPGIIRRQLKLLDAIVADENKKPTPDKGILAKVKMAREFYAKLAAK